MAELEMKKSRGAVASSTTAGGTPTPHATEIGIGIVPPAFPIVNFSGESDTTPRAEALSWPQLIERLRSHKRLPRKEDSALWSPAVYWPGSTRGNDGVKAITVLVFDVDHGAQPHEISAELKKLGLAHIVYSTYRHTIDAPRFRVVIPLTRHVSALEWPEFWKRANWHIMHQVADGGAKDLARMFYWPSCPPGAPVVAFDVDGLALNPDALPAVKVSSKPNSNGNGRAPDNGKPKIDIPDDELIRKAKAAKDGAKFCTLWEGGTHFHGGDDSKADQALCNLLAFWTDRDAPRMDRLFRQSGLYRNKWDEKHYSDGRTYGEGTIEKAIAGCSEGYSPNGTAQEQEPETPEPPVEPRQLAEVIAAFQRWLHLPDPDGILAMLATVAANIRDGDPVWLIIVGPPGFGKTEGLNAISDLPRVFPVAVLTEASLLSGTPQKDRSKSAKGGLLHEIGELGVMVVKDFGGILSMHKDARGPVLAALREVYDGSWTRYVGADGGRALRWEGKCGLIGGATPSIDGHHGVMATLGERFAFYRLPEDGRQERATKALAHFGREREMRAELSAVVKGLFAGLDIITPVVELTEPERDYLITLADLVVQARSPVERDLSSPSREISLIPGAEAPTRFVKVLAQLFGGLLVVGVERTHAWRIVRKVAMDSMPQARRRALELLAKQTTSRTTRQIATELRYPTNTIRRSLEELTAYNVVEREEGEGSAGDKWVLSKWARNYYERTICVPEIWQEGMNGGGEAEGLILTDNSPNHIWGTQQCEYEEGIL